MATKDATLILHANLECEKCYKKIQKLLCKLQSKEDIRKIDYDNTKNRVTISGNFDPEKLSKKLKCKACDAIKNIEIKPKEEKKQEEKKQEEKKKQEDKKPEDKKKPEEDKKKAVEETTKGDDKAKQATPAAAGRTTVNLQFNNICGICYPWPCSNPAHWGGLHHPQQLPHQWPQLPAPARAPCGGPSFCGGCAWCHGGGGGGGNCWVPPQPQPMCCPGPSLCRGCNGCKIVRESKFSYEEYPSSTCAIM